jgi:hypothetical protein
MPFLYVDGPERAGKSSYIQLIAEAWRNRLASLQMPEDGGLRVRHWGPISDSYEGQPGDYIYVDAFQKDLEDISPNFLVVWDRGPISEAVYSFLLNRPNRRLATNWFLLHSLHIKPMLQETRGLCFILTGPESEVLESRRTKEDLAVSPYREKLLFETIGFQLDLPIIGSSVVPGNSLNHHTWDSNDPEMIAWTIGALG